MICPDCGLTYESTTGGPAICPECLNNAAPEPQDGWPIIARWVSPNRGRGVFARRFIAQGEVIERCWIMPLSVEESTASADMPVLNRYLFPWVDKQRVLLSGAGFLYNLDRLTVTRREPNTECVIRVGISAIEFRAMREIRQGEELTWDYQKAAVRRR